MESPYEAYERSAEVYDAIYGAMVDYDASARRVHEVIQARRPGAATLLDVACGTGQYTGRLAEHYAVRGVDRSAAMLHIARRRLPEIRFDEADMTDFDVGATFDAVVCLFSSVGYLPSVAALRSAAGCFARHTAPGGVVVVEPWIAPDRWIDGLVGMDTAEAEGLRVVRVAASRRTGNRARMRFGYAVGRAGGDVEAFVEEHDTTLFTHEEYWAALDAAGFTVEHDPEGLIGRGLYVGVRRPSAG